MDTKQLHVTILMGLLAGATVVAPMFGMAGIAIGLVAACVLITVAFQAIFNAAQRPQIHQHYHYRGEVQQAAPRPYTEGHERKALLPNGTQVQERTIRRYDQ